MVQKMLALPIKTIELLEEITDLILIKVWKYYYYCNIINDYMFIKIVIFVLLCLIQTLQKTKYTSIFVQFCAYLIKDPKFNKPTDSKTTFQKLIAQKCYDMCIYYKVRQEDELKTLFKYSKKMVNRYLCFK